MRFAEKRNTNSFKSIKSSKKNNQVSFNELVIYCQTLINKLYKQRYKQ